MGEIEENNISDDINNEGTIIVQEGAKYSGIVKELLEKRDNIK